jgi:hypothetical protein
MVLGSLYQPCSAWSPFAYLTGWRKGEIISLKWTEMPGRFDLTGGPRPLYTPKERAGHQDGGQQIGERHRIPVEYFRDGDRVLLVLDRH